MNLRNQLLCLVGELVESEPEAAARILARIEADDRYSTSDCEEDRITVVVALRERLASQPPSELAPSGTPSPLSPETASTLALAEDMARQIDGTLPDGIAFLDSLSGTDLEVFADAAAMEQREGGATTTT